MRISPPRISIETLAVLAAAVSAGLGGVAAVLIRFLAGEADPLTIAWLRYVTGPLVMLPFLLHYRVRIARADWLPLLLLGIMFFGVFPVGFSAAFEFTTASRGAVITATMPLSTLALACLVRAERLTIRRLAGIVLAVLGVVVALGDRAVAPEGAADLWRGDLIMAAAVLLVSTYNVLSRPFLHAYPVIVITAIGITTGVLVQTPFVVAGGLFTDFPAFGPGGWVAVGILGTLCGVGSLYLWIWALQNTAPSKVAICVTVNPMVAALLGALVLGEPVTALFLLGLAGVIGGLVLVTLPPRRIPAPPG